MNKREQKRNEYSEKVCRELRYQLAHKGFIYDYDSFKTLDE